MTRRDTGRRTDPARNTVSQDSGLPREADELEAAEADTISSRHAEGPKACDFTETAPPALERACGMSDRAHPNE